MGQRRAYYARGGGLFDENGVRYIDGRQEQLIVVNKPFNSL